MIALYLIQLPHVEYETANSWHTCRHSSGQSPRTRTTVKEHDIQGPLQTRLRTLANILVMTSGTTSALLS